MSIQVFKRYTITCNACPNTVTVHADTAAQARASAAWARWRRDKLSQDLCPVHPKLKGARRG